MEDTSSVSFSSTTVAGEEFRSVTVSLNVTQQPSGFYLGAANHGFPSMNAVSMPPYGKYKWVSGVEIKAGHSAMCNLSSWPVGAFLQSRAVASRIYWNNLPADTNPGAAGENWRLSKGEGNCLPVLHLVWRFLSGFKAKSWQEAGGNLPLPPRMGGDCVEEPVLKIRSQWVVVFIGNSINIPWESTCFFNNCLSPL